MKIRVLRESVAVRLLNENNDLGDAGNSVSEPKQYVRDDDKIDLDLLLAGGYKDAPYDGEDPDDYKNFMDTYDDSDDNLWEARTAAPVDEDTAKDLYDYIESCVALKNAHSQLKTLVLAVGKNLDRHRKRGEYDAKRAVDAMRHIADYGAQLYRKEYHGDEISPATRQACAKLLLDNESLIRELANKN